MAYRLRPVNLAGKPVNREWKLSHPGEIVFDSMMERDFYKALTRLGIKFEFHPDQKTLCQGFTIPALSRGKAEKFIMSTVRPIRYTPDFKIFADNGIIIYIETKGYFTEDARLRYKLFQASLDQTKEFTFILYNEKEIKKLLNLITESFIKINKLAENAKRSLEKI